MSSDTERPSSPWLTAEQAASYLQTGIKGRGPRGGKRGSQSGAHRRPASICTNREFLDAYVLSRAPKDVAHECLTSTRSTCPR